ncbi:MAG: hypothetical protein JWQ02_4154 [Capsulimonas sp.]|jgi:hypothetical protein|nr:hypothetical protein [Capsulimonas sp.]
MHSLLEEYLEEVYARLLDMPFQRRVEELRELRAHLQDAMLANERPDISQEKAAHVVLSHFGSPGDVAQELMGAWVRDEETARRSFWRALGCYLACQLILSHYPLFFSYFAKLPSYGPLSDAYYTVGAFWWSPLCYLTVGFGLGIAFPKRGTAGIGAGMCAVACCWFLGAMSTARYLGSAPPPDPFMVLFPTLGLSDIYGNVFLLMAAWFGGRLRQSGFNGASFAHRLA